MAGLLCEGGKFETGQGDLLRVGIETAGGREPRRETGLVLHLIDGSEAGSRIVLGDQEPDRVRADVDRAEALAGLAGRGSHLPALTLAPNTGGSPRSSA